MADIEVKGAIGIKIEEVQPQVAAVVEYKTSMDEISKSMSSAFGEVMGLLGKLGVSYRGMPFTLYPEMEPDKEGKWHAISGIAVPGEIAEEGRVKNYYLPGGQVAIATHIGPYETMEKTYKLMDEQIRSEGYQPGGMMWEYYFSDPQLEPDSSKWRTDIYWLVERK